MSATTEVAARPTTPSTPDRPSLVSRVFGLDLLDNRYASLHGLRVIAILSVIQFHVTWIFAGEQGIVLDRDFVDSSLTVFFGMDLFFMLSGFLIGSILLHSIESAGSQQIRRFYLRRVFRTFPSYYVVLTFLALVETLNVAQRSHLIYEYFYATNFVWLRRDNVLMFWGWSLALEEQFYLAVPLLFFLLYKLRSDRSRVIVLGAIWLAALVVRLSIFHRFRPWNDFVLYGALYFKTYTRFDTLVAGLILAVVHRRWRKDIQRWLELPFHRALLALPALTCLWLLLRPGMFGAQYVQIFHVFAWGTLTTIMYFCGLLLLLNGGDGLVQRALSRPFFRQIATLGYGVYLVHIPICDHWIVPIAHALDARHVPRSVLWIGSLAALSLLSLAIAYAMHVFIEKPSLRIRDRIAA